MIITLYASVTTVLQFWNRHVGDCNPGKTFQGYVRSNYSRKCCHSRILGFYHNNANDYYLGHNLWING